MRMKHLIFKAGGFTDIAVFHPISKYENNRPKWVFNSPNKKVKIDFKDADISFPVLVLAYFKNEDLRYAVPTDIIEIKNKNDIGFLALKKGKYTIVVTNKFQNAIKFSLNVR